MGDVLRIGNATIRRRADGLYVDYGGNTKHDFYKDFGYPAELTFKDHFFKAYTRNGIARSAIDRTAGKTWETTPKLLEREGDHDETQLEREIREKFGDLRLWPALVETDRRSMVGSYAALILRLADGRAFSEPAEQGGGLDRLVEVIPAWEAQLEVSSWDTSETSETYGQPLMFQFNEAAVDNNRKHQRAFSIHPDRVLIWSRDGTVHGRSVLEPGYNDLVTMEKIAGAGGEGFWKNAKSAPVIEVDKEARIEEMARAMGVEVDELVDKMGDQVEGFQKGFDELLMLMGMQAKTLNVTLPSPEHFFAIALQSFAASMSIPMKILVGSQTGERASTEDAEEWAKTCMSRRRGQTEPNVMLLVNKLEALGILHERDWALDWEDLTEASMSEKIERADKMATVNQKMEKTGEFIFTPDEIRGAIGYEPLSDADKYREGDPDELPEPDEEPDDEPAPGE